MPDGLVAHPPWPVAAEPCTRREILQQPETLRATHALLVAAEAEITAFLGPLLARPGLRIVLTGAGTSAFIGECLAPWLSRSLGRTVEAIASTDIVSAPSLWLRADAPTLLVSFGRSGGSPESIAAADLADAMVRDVHHLIVTCNAAGALARRIAANVHVVVLPEATHDRGFAMTSSFTAMMYAALAILSGIATMAGRLEAIVRAVADVATTCEPQIAALARRGFQRVVYLGSGVLKGLARESALKLLELSDGAVPTLFDTAMGVRHGPKTFLTPATLVVVFVSNDPLTRRYDLDIIDELRADGRSGAVIAVAARGACDDGIAIDHLAGAPDVDLLFPFVVPAQLFGLHTSLCLGLTPDQPNASGTVNRVVQGVTIHAGGA